MIYMAAAGYTQPVYEERLRAWLLGTVAGTSASMTIEQMWQRLGLNNAYPVIDTESIMWQWARLTSGLAAGSAMGDCFAALPPFDVNLNLITNGSFVDGTGWTTGTGWSIGAGIATKTPGVTADLSQPTAVPVPGATYRITATYVLNAGILYSRIGNTQSPQHTVSGTYVDDLVAANTIPFAIRGGSTADGSVTNISCRRIA